MVSVPTDAVFSILYFAFDKFSLLLSLLMLDRWVNCFIILHFRLS